MHVVDPTTEVARTALEEQLRSLNLLGPHDTLGGDADEAHKHLWADHGDAISAQYSGTRALKRDVTRTGRRTMGGLMTDLNTALTRYYRSKFTDGSAQDCLNLWANHFLVDVAKPSPFTKPKRDYCLNQPLLVDEE